MFKLTNEVLDKIKNAIISDFQPAMAGPNVAFVTRCAPCSGTCKAACRNNCSGSCKGGCTRSCKGNSR